MMKNIFWVLLIALTVYLFSIFDNSDEFQSVVMYVVNIIQSIKSLVIAQFWIDNRMMIWGGIIIFLILFYRSIWPRYQTIISIFKNKSISAQKPSLSVEQANYICFQNKTTSLGVWLIQLCRQGGLTLHYNKQSNTPWSMSRSTTKVAFSEFDQQSLIHLFKSKNKITLKGLGEAPNPEIKALSDRVFKKITSENDALMQRNISSFSVWLVLLCLFIEIPFISGVYSNTPGIIFIAACLVGITAFFVFIFIFQLSFLINGHYLLSLAFLIVPILMLIVSHSGLLGVGNSNYYFFILFYPEIVVSIALLIYLAPVLPKKQYLSSQIIAYKQYLQQVQKAISEADIPWTLGLQESAGIYGVKYNYQESEIPAWIESNETDAQKLVDELHITFFASIDNAVNGVQKNEHSRKRFKLHRF